MKEKINSITGLFGLIALISMFAYWFGAPLIVPRIIVGATAFIYIINAAMEPASKMDKVNAGIWSFNAFLWIFLIQ
jgi:hypothetical protein